MTFKLIFYYIYWSIRLGIPAWYYFQINAEWYNKKKGFYSKIDIDRYIPIKWRLEQVYFNRNNLPTQFPVFLKPEWGQNSNGIIRVDSKAEFLAFNENNSKIPYIVQQVASEAQEYEIFYIRDVNYPKRYTTFTITQAINNSKELYPINNINNPAVYYQDCSTGFSTIQKQNIQQHLQELPNFRIARIGLRANSKKDLIQGVFHIIEVNLFAPFPINLLDKDTDKKAKHKFIKESMYHLVKISNTIPKQYFNRLVFFKKVIKHYQSKI